MKKTVIIMMSNKKERKKTIMVLIICRQVMTVSQLIPHPSYDSSIWKDDIACKIRGIFYSNLGGN
jgi:hypothetical protein